MADATDVILRLTDKQWSSAMQARERMASLTNALLISAAVLQGAVVVRGFDTPSLLAAAIIIGLGLFGGLSSRRAELRFRAEMERFGRLAKRLDELTPDAGLVALEQGPLEDDDRGLSLASVVGPGLVSLGIINVALVIFL
jgi:hypothetical protein